MLSKPVKQPLLLPTLLYAAGILTARYFCLPAATLLTAAFAITLVVVFWSRRRSILLPLLLFLTGWANSTLHTAMLSPNDLRLLVGDQPHLATVHGTLLETPSLRVLQHDDKELWRTLAQLEVTTVALDGQPPHPAVGRVAVTTPKMLTNLFAGQTVEINGVLASPKSAIAEGTFDYRSYLSQLGIYYHLKADSEADWTICSSVPTKPLADRFRDWAKPALALGLPVEDESLRLEWALTLGWKTALTEEVSDPFVQAATYHIFAVDGLRMAFVFGILFYLFRAIGLPRPVSGSILLPILWFYVALTGWPASAIRATVMLSIVILGWVLKRPGNLLNSLFLAALVILLWQPSQLFQAGFQLSFLVVLYLILILPPLHNLFARWFSPDPFLPQPLWPTWRRAFRVPIRFTADVFLTSLAAWLGSIPLAAYYFHIFTPVSTPANLLAVPLCALTLISNLSSLLLASWFPFAAELLNNAGWLCMETIRLTSHWFAGWPAAYYYVPAPNLLGICVYYALLLAVVTGWLFRPRLLSLRIAAVAISVLVWSTQLWLAHMTDRLTILPVSGGLTVHFDARGMQNDLLIDCGTSNSVAGTVKPFLRAQGVNRLPRLVLTHGDIQHVGGAEMAADLFSIQRVCISPVRFRSPAYRRIVGDFEQLLDKTQKFSRGDHIGQWSVLHPEATDRFPQADDNALVLFGDFHGVKILLLSDLGRPGQEALLERNQDLHADIVVTGLPSASEALSDALLDAIQPQVIIVGDSEFPASARASPNLRERLDLRHIPVIYTRFDGATTIDLRHDSWQIRTMSGRKLTGTAVGPRAVPARSSTSGILGSSPWPALVLTF
jgi:competence protein ComEC